MAREVASFERRARSANVSCQEDRSVSSSRSEHRTCGTEQTSRHLPNALKSKMAVLRLELGFP